MRDRGERQLAAGADRGVERRLSAPAGSPGSPRRCGCCRRRRRPWRRGRRRTGRAAPAGAGRGAGSRRGSGGRSPGRRPTAPRATAAAAAARWRRASRSSRTVARLAPAMPSRRQWWYFISMPSFPPARPSMYQISQSGRRRSSWVEREVAGELAELLGRCPATGTAMRRTWRRTSNSGSSTHTGRSRPRGTSFSFQRELRGVDDPLGDLRDHVLEGHRPVAGVEDGQAGHVLVPGRRLHREEQRVGSAKSLHGVVLLWFVAARSGSARRFGAGCQPAWRSSGAAASSRPRTRPSTCS